MERFNHSILKALSRGLSRLWLLVLVLAVLWGQHLPMRAPLGLYLDQPIYSSCLQEADMSVAEESVMSEAGYLMETTPRADHADARNLAVEYNSAGTRHREFRSAILASQSDEWKD